MGDVFSGILMLAAILVVVVAGLWAGRWVLALFNRRPHKLDTYSISLEDHPGGKSKVLHLWLKAENGSSRTFELDSRFAHVLSDELLTASGKAVRGSHAVPAQ